MVDERQRGQNRAEGFAWGAHGAATPPNGPAVQQQYPGGQQPFPGGPQFHPNMQAPGPGMTGQPQPHPMGGAPPQLWQHGGPSSPMGFAPAPYPGMPGPPGSRSNVGLIIGLVVAMVVVLVLTVVGIGVVASRSGGDDEADPWAGDYSPEGVTNTCHLVDTTVFDPWAPDQTELVHHEDIAGQYGGPSIDCRTTNSGPNSAYVTFKIDVAFETDLYGLELDRAKRSDTEILPDDYVFGSVTGLGEGGYYGVRNPPDSDRYLGYTMAIKDSNVLVDVDVAVISDKAFDQAEADRICRYQIGKILDNLRK